MPKIFVSYRRKDSADTVGRICDRLGAVLGEENVFKDVDSIAPGSEFAAVIDRQLDQCDAILVVIGLQWLTARTPEGSLRLNEANDMVRMEVEKALSKQMLVVPVLVGSASMPTEKELPRSIRDLIKRNAISVRPDPDFNKDISLLIQALKKEATRSHEKEKHDGYFRLVCPKCRKHVKLLPSHGGNRIRCPHCSASLMADKACSILYDTPFQKPAQPAPAQRVLYAAHPNHKTRKAGGFLRMTFIALLLFGGAGVAAWYFLSRPETHSITGTIHITFKSPDMKPGDKASDIYDVNLYVRSSRKKVNYKGRIIGNVSKEGEGNKTKNLDFRIEVEECPLSFLGQPSNDERTVLGSIKGVVPVTKGGLYQFEKLKWIPSIGSAPVSFSGQVQGKNGEEAARGEKVNYGGGNLIEIDKADPMEFKALVLPGQPGVRQTTIRGFLVFDYESDRYFTNDLSFSYSDKSDKVKGAIFWKKLEGYPDDKTTADKVAGAKSRYDFTLVFNAKSSPADARAGQKMKGVDAPVFEVNSSMSTLKGTIDYSDDGLMEINKKGKKELKPRKSVVTFDLKANRLNDEQVHNFLKMWLLMSGPINDE